MNVIVSRLKRGNKSKSKLRQKFNKSMCSIKTPHLLHQIPGNTQILKQQSKMVVVFSFAFDVREETTLDFAKKIFTIITEIFRACDSITGNVKDYLTMH